MLPDAAYLHHIMDACDEIEFDCAGLSRDDFLSTRTHRNSALYQLVVIGEAASQISLDFRQRRPEVPWRDIVDMRNRIVHNYFGVDYNLLWKTITEDIPRLRSQIADILTIDLANE